MFYTVVQMWLNDYFGPILSEKSEKNDELQYRDRTQETTYFCFQILSSKQAHEKNIFSEMTYTKCWSILKIFSNNHFSIYQILLEFDFLLSLKMWLFQWFTILNATIRFFRPKSCFLTIFISTILHFLMKSWHFFSSEYRFINFTS